MIDQLMYIILILLLLNVVHQMESYAQVHEPVIILQAFFTLVMQCENSLMVVFWHVAFAIDILLNVSLCTSVLNGLTIIFDAFGSKIAKVNKNGCTCHSNSDFTMIVRCKDFVGDFFGLLFIDNISVLKNITKADDDYINSNNSSSTTKINILNGDMNTIRVFGNMRSSIKTLGNDIVSINIGDYSNTGNSVCIGNDCAGTVTVGADMKMKDLNDNLSKYGYFVRGYDSTQSITIGGALSSCNIRSLYDGKPFGYYLVKVWVIDGLGEKGVFSIENSYDIDYLDAFRCNLGVVYQLTLEMINADVACRGVILEIINNNSDTLEEYFVEEHMLCNHSRYANKDIHGHDHGETIDVFNDVESVLDLIVRREIYVNLYNIDLVGYIHFKELNSNIAFADNFNNTDENELSLNYTYSKENGSIRDVYNIRELYNFVINPTACVFSSIIDIVDHIIW